MQRDRATLPFQIESNTQRYNSAGTKQPCRRARGKHQQFSQVVKETRQEILPRPGIAGQNRMSSKDGTGRRTKAKAKANPCKS